jgi:2-polyprenyl-3-methyl-5-hydroxy-6-metoxy-1,4-benzoquinol methylase
MINLENGGERMDINYYNMNYNNFDIYQKSHFKRYEFVKTFLNETDIVGDFACGSGYGSAMMSEKSKFVIGCDLCDTTINEINHRYEKINNVKFEQKNILDLNYEDYFDKIISFETLEHFIEEDISKIIKLFHSSLKENGTFIFSTPYDQEKSENSMRFHKTFYITEEIITNFLNPFFKIENFYYQNYNTHEISSTIQPKHFLICVAKKIN